MRFLADESLDFAVVRRLRADGHDVVALAESAPRSSDVEVVALAVRDGRVLLTEDKDFGQLVFAEKRATAGVILIRYPGNPRSILAQAVAGLVAEQGERLASRFVVIEPGRVRLGPPRGAA